jgi:hypothetical protein
MDRIYFGIQMSLAVGRVAVKRTERSSSSREFERSPDVGERSLYQKKAAGLRTLRLLLVLSEAPRRLSLKEPRDQSYADRWCLRNKHARVRRV